MHTHNGEVITTFRNEDIEGRVTFSGFVESENSFRVSEDILGTNETVHGSLDTHEGSFSGDSSGGTLGVGQLLTSSDSSEGNVVSAEHTNSVFHLEGGGTHQSTIGADGGDGTVNDVIYLVSLQGESFT